MDPAQTSHEMRDRTLHADNSGDGSKTVHIEKDIARTRHRMDETLDQIAGRLRPRHLLDEVIGWVRSSPGGMEQTQQTAKHMGKKLVHWIEDHPMPTLLLGGAIGLYVYESWRHGNGNGNEAILEEEWSAERDYGLDATSAGAGWGVSTEYEETETVHGPGWSQGGGAGGVKEKAREVMGSAREKAQELGDRARSTLSRARRRAMEAGAQAREAGAYHAGRVGARAREAWYSGRDHMVDAIDERPMAVGLGVLALGVIAGLLVPRTRAEEELMGETAQRLREKTREVASEAVERGKRVVAAAATAATREAEAQGITPEQVTQKLKNEISGTACAGQETGQGSMPIG